LSDEGVAVQLSLSDRTVLVTGGGSEPCPDDAAPQAHPRKQPSTKHRGRTPPQRQPRRRTQQTTAVL